MLMDRIVIDRNTAGNAIIWGLICHNARPSAMMLPHEGIEGGTPAPMKDKLASARIARPQIYVV
jgi:hypothetical protein